MRNVHDDPNRIGAESLITDLGVAFAFLDVARASRGEEARRRNCKNARRVHDTVLALLPKANVNEAERLTINEKLALLKEQLEAVEEEF
jgi:hypothetical protein